MQSNDKNLNNDILKAGAAAVLENVVPGSGPVLRLVESICNRLKGDRDRKIRDFFSNIGDEMNCGTSDDLWKKLQDEIDDPRISSTVVQAARSAVDGFDESVIPYLANIVCLLINDKDASVGRRRLIRLLADCDNVTLEALRHLSSNAYSHWDNERDIGYIIANDTKYQSEAALVQEGGLWSEFPNRWPLETVDYIDIFALLKRNCLGSDGDSGSMGDRSGPNVIVLRKQTCKLLHDVLFSREPNPAT